MPKPRRHVLVCLHERAPEDPRGSCAQKGSEELFLRLKRAVAQRGLDDEVLVSRTGCLKQCSQGATVVVYPEAVWYANVRLEDVEELIASHLEGGRPVERLLLTWSS